MKIKSLVLLVLLLFSMGCSSIQFKREGFFEDVKYIKVVKLYENWELEEAEKEIILLEKESPDDINLKRLRVLVSEKAKLKSDLYELVESVKNAIKKNDIDEIRKYTKKSFLNKKKLNELEKNDFTIFDIYSGEIEFKNERAEAVTVLNYGDEMFYISVKFKLEKREWKIVDFFERR